MNGERTDINCGERFVLSLNSQKLSFFKRQIHSEASAVYFLNMHCLLRAFSLFLTNLMGDNCEEQVFWTKVSSNSQSRRDRKGLCTTTLKENFNINLENATLRHVIF